MKQTETPSFTLLSLSKASQYCTNIITIRPDCQDIFVILHNITHGQLASSPQSAFSAIGRKAWFPGSRDK